MYEQMKWQALRDEFIKIAKSKEKGRAGSAAMGLGAAGTAGGLGLNIASGVGMMGAGRAERDALGNDVLRNSLHAASPVPVAEHEIARRAGGGLYAGEGAIKYIKRHGKPADQLPHDVPHILVSPDSPSSILAHEMGHAQIDKGRLGKLFQSVPSSIIQHSSPLIAPAAGLLAGRYTDENKHTGLGIAAGVPLGITAANLGVEGTASYKGLKNLRNAGASPAQIAAAKKTLGRAFGTYAGVGALATGLGVGAYGVGRRMRSKAQEQEAARAQHAQQMAALQGQ